MEAWAESCMMSRQAKDTWGRGEGEEEEEEGVEDDTAREMSASSMSTPRMWRL